VCSPLSATPAEEQITAPEGQADFLAVRDLVEPDQREWLVQSLTLTSPTHPWLTQL